MPFNYEKLKALYDQSGEQRTEFSRVIFGSDSKIGPKYFKDRKNGVSSIYLERLCEHYGVPISYFFDDSPVPVINPADFISRRHTPTAVQSEPTADLSAAAVAGASTLTPGTTPSQLRIARLEQTVEQLTTEKATLTERLAMSDRVISRLEDDLARERDLNTWLRSQYTALSAHLHTSPDIPVEPEKDEKTTEQPVD